MAFYMSGDTPPVGVSKREPLFSLHYQPGLGFYVFMGGRLLARLPFEMTLADCLRLLEQMNATPRRAA